MRRLSIGVLRPLVYKILIGYNSVIYHDLCGNLARMVSGITIHATVASQVTQHAHPAV
jgi:hypothetical protein